MLNYGVPSWFYEENSGIHKADGSAQTPPRAVLPRPFRYHRSFMYAAVTDISYMVESVASMLVCLLCSIDAWVT